MWFRYLYHYALYSIHVLSWLLVHWWVHLPKIIFSDLWGPKVIVIRICGAKLESFRKRGKIHEIDDACRSFSLFISVGHDLSIYSSWKIRKATPPQWKSSIPIIAPYIHSKKLWRVLVGIYWGISWGCRGRIKLLVTVMQNDVQYANSSVEEGYPGYKDTLWKSNLFCEYVGCSKFGALYEATELAFRSFNKRVPWVHHVLGAGWCCHIWKHNFLIWVKIGEIPLPPDSSIPEVSSRAVTEVGIRTGVSSVRQPCWDVSMKHEDGYAGAQLLPKGWRSRFPRLSKLSHPGDNKLNR